MNVSSELLERLLRRSCADLAIAVVLVRSGDHGALQRVWEHSDWTTFLCDRLGGVEVYPDVRR